MPPGCEAAARNEGLEQLKCGFPEMVQRRKKAHVCLSPHLNNKECAHMSVCVCMCAHVALLSTLCAPPADQSLWEQGPACRQPLAAHCAVRTLVGLPAGRR